MNITSELKHSLSTLFVEEGRKIPSVFFFLSDVVGLLLLFFFTLYPGIIFLSYQSQVFTSVDQTDVHPYCP